MSGVNERTSHSPDDKVKLSCKDMVPHLGGRLSKLLFSNSKSVFFKCRNKKTSLSDVDQQLSYSYVKVPAKWLLNSM